MTKKPRRIVSAVAILLAGVCAAVDPATAEPSKVEPPLSGLFRKADRSVVAGKIVAYDDAGFELTTRDGDTVRPRWTEFDVDTVFRIHQKLLASDKGTGWVRLGSLLLAMEGGEARAAGAFAVAMRLDPTLDGEVEKARSSKGAEAPAVAVGQDSSLPAREAAAGPDAQPPSGAWPVLDEKQQAAAVAELKTLSDRAREMLGVELTLLETTYFLFYTDLPAAEAVNWAKLLDRMYDRLCFMFDVDKGVNIWRGKALVFVFTERADFMQFEARIMGVQVSGGIAGLCHQRGNGDVIIAFYRQEDEMGFATVLVHEAVHGFAWRYEAPVILPSWANEGLAEWLARELVPKSDWVKNKERRALQILEQRGRIGDGFFDASHIAGWQYGVASSLADFMIAHNRRGYVQFIQDVKAGTPWRESLEKHFRSIEFLVAAYGQGMGIRELGP